MAKVIVALSMWLDGFIAAEITARTPGSRAASGRPFRRPPARQPALRVAGQCIMVGCHCSRSRASRPP